MGGTGRPLGETFFLQCQRRHPELPKIPTYLYRQQLIDEFRDTVFSPLKYDPEAWKVPGPREISKVKLTLIEGAVPRSSKAIRAVGIRETLLYEKIQTFLDRGYIVKSNDNADWVSRAFLVPKPNGKWRLVIDYRYVNTQLKGQNFPPPPSLKIN